MTAIGDYTTDIPQPAPRSEEAENGRPRYPAPVLSDIREERLETLRAWLDEQLEFMIAEQQQKQTQWGEYERAYRAAPDAPSDIPFRGCSRDVMPVIAMNVDPIHARLDTGIFKNDPVFRVKGLRKSLLKYVPALEWWIEYYQKNRLKLRRIASPRMLECAKLGTMVFKTVYDRDEHTAKTYDEDFKVIDRKIVRFKGPRVLGISLGDFLFPPGYQDVQEAPIVAERQRTTFGKLKVAEDSGKLQNVDRLRNQEVYDRTALESAREDATEHTRTHFTEDLVVYEVWCEYDINGDDLPEHLVITYHRETRTFLQLRYNWYFHQRKPYTVIPYTVTNESLYGLGIAEMVLPLQKMLTQWDRMAKDNAYIANIRMFIVKQGSGIEEVPRLYAGRCFFVDDPKSDFIPFSAGEIYPSTLTERQNLMGIVEKRTGISDYLTGRESPIIGSRATATTTIALLQEGTRRVEEVLENIREGFSEVIQNCLDIWIQYGTEDLSDIAFKNDEIGNLLEEFFTRVVTKQNVNGAIGIELSATDAQGSRQIQQQMQLSIIQVMMTYLEKLLAVGQAAIQAEQQGNVQFAAMLDAVITASRRMFRDLLHKYDIRNPEDYLPDLGEFLNGPATGQDGSVGVGGAAGQLAPAGGAVPGIPRDTPPPTGARVPQPSAPGSGGLLQ